MKTIPRNPVRCCVQFVLLTLAGVAGAAAADLAELARINEQAQAAHRQRCLNDASRQYRQLLQLDPALDPTTEQMALVLKYAPRLHRVRGEFFPLKDIVAILHPERPIIAYRLLWEDDLGFPSDNDHCDHEVVWIEFDPTSGAVVHVATYFHGEILAPPEAVEEANAHGGRAWFGVEWGFHGSVPHGGLDAARPVLQKHWERATAGRDGPADPLARGWPTRYEGSFAAYLDFAEHLDPRPMLQERALVWVSRWPMAVLNRCAVRYNTAVKHDWP